MTDKTDTIPQVSLLAYKVAQERARRTIHGLLIGWTLSAAALAVVLGLVLLA